MGPPRCGRHHQEPDSPSPCAGADAGAARDRKLQELPVGQAQLHLILKRVKGSALSPPRSLLLL